MQIHMHAYHPPTRFLQIPMYVPNSALCLQPWVLLARSLLKQVRAEITETAFFRA